MANSSLHLLRRAEPVLQFTTGTVLLWRGLSRRSLPGLLVAYAQGGDDVVEVRLPSSSAWLFGQGGDDTLRAGNGDSVLVGGPGDDTATGGNGKDLLVGGLGADVLDGGNAADVLIAGATAYDAGTAADRHAWCHLQDEWVRGSGGYAGRVGHLSGATGGRNGSHVFSAATLVGDADPDRLTGRAGDDWFILSRTDDQHDAGRGEILTDL